MISRVWHRLGQFFRLKKSEMVWFVLLFMLSGLARAAILLVPFRYLSPLLGKHKANIQLAALATEEQKMVAWRIGRLADSVSKYTPWESKCLVQALIARVLLAYYRIPFVMHLGVTKSNETEPGEDQLKAHAWLTVGPWVVTGREGHKSFTIVSTFVHPSLSDPCD